MEGEKREPRVQHFGSSTAKRRLENRELWVNPVDDVWRIGMGVKMGIWDLRIW